MALHIALKPGDRVMLDEEIIIVCARARAGELRLEITAPPAIVITHSRGADHISKHDGIDDTVYGLPSLKPTQ